MVKVLLFFEDVSTADADVGTEDINDTTAVEMSDTSTSCDYFGDCSNTTQPEEQITADEAIKDSPQRAVRIKRLSKISPEHGPVLKISPSADRLILGIESGKENESAAKPKKSKDLHRAVVTKELRKASLETEQGATVKQIPVGDPSLLLEIFTDFAPSYDRLQGAREEDEECRRHLLLPTAHIIQGFKTVSRSKARESDETFQGTDDPFFDAKSQFEGAARNNKEEAAITAHGDVGNAAITESALISNEETFEEDSWISPMRNASGSNRASDTVPVTPAFLPVTVREHLSGLYDDSNGERVTSGSEAPRSSMSDCTRNSYLETVDSDSDVETRPTPGEAASVTRSNVDSNSFCLHLR
jgi:hypothetical protein